MSPLPLSLPMMTRGRAALRPAAAAGGRLASERAAVALAALAGHAVRVSAAPRARPFAPAAAAVRLGLSFGDVTAPAVLEVDARLAARLVDVVAGGPGDGPPASSLTQVESAALELLVLVALDAVADALPALAPRLLATAPEDVPGALVVDVELAVGPVRGGIRLALPPGVVAALGEAAPAESAAGRDGAAAGMLLPVSVRRDLAVLAEEELAALGPGDVVLVERGRDTVVLPGGVALVGALEDDGLRVEESRRDEWAGTFPLALGVEVARVPVGVRDLARLAPGACLRLELPTQGEVVLRAGEHAVARGRLVEVDGARGVRIDAIERGVRGAAAVAAGEPAPATDAGSRERHATWTSCAHDRVDP